MSDNTNKENQVHSFNGGKVLYIEPNDVFGYTKDDDGNNIPITPPYQDMCITFDLVADVYARTSAGIRTASRSSMNDTILTRNMLSFHTDARMRQETFMPGTGYGKVDKKTGKFEDYYLTTYYTKKEFGAYIADQQVVEGLGVESVQISMEHWYTPTVVINFVDVRGVALWGQEESIHNENGAITSESVFGSFFTLPYPVFHLMVKGFFGRPVTYQLSLSQFKGNYEMDGSFKATATFIGYQYSLLTDIPMRYLVAAPYCNYEGKKYWESHVESDAWKLSGGKTPPRLYEFFESVNGAVFVNPENEAGNLSDTNLATYVKERKLLVDIKETIDKIKNKLAFGGRRLMECENEVNHNTTLYFLENPVVASNQSASNPKSYITLSTLDIKNEVETLNIKLTEYNSQFSNRLGGGMSKFVTQITKFITTQNGEMEMNKFMSIYEWSLAINPDGLTWASVDRKVFNDVKKYFTEKLKNVDNLFDSRDVMRDLNGLVTKEIWGGVLKDFYNEFIKRKSVLPSDEWFDKNEKRVDIGMFCLYDVYYQIHQRLNTIDEETKAIQKSIDMNRNFDILSAIKFTPYIGDFMKIVMCHLETFIHMVKQTEIDAKIDPKKRKLIGESWVDFENKTINGETPTVPCWVGVTKTDTKLTEIDEKGNHPIEGSVSWLGAFEDDELSEDYKFVETKFIDSLLEALACTITVPSEPKPVNENANNLETYPHFPVLPFDFNVSDNPFSGTISEICGTYPIQAIAGYIGIRLGQLGAYIGGCYDEDSLKVYDFVEQMAKLDAYSWYQACGNGTKFNKLMWEPLQELKDENGIAKNIKLMLEDSVTVDKFKITRGNGSKSYPFQICKVSNSDPSILDKEDQRVLKMVEDMYNSQYYYVDYIDDNPNGMENGSTLTPTRFLPFNQYRPGGNSSIIETSPADGRIIAQWRDLDDGKGSFLANNWISRDTSIYKGTDNKVKYNNDVLNIIDAPNVVKAIKDKFWQIKNSPKKGLYVTDEFTDQIPDFDYYLSQLYSNFDRRYERWFCDDRDICRHLVLPGKTFKDVKIPVTDKATYLSNSTEQVNNMGDILVKRLKVRTMTDGEVEDDALWRNDVIFENQKKNEQGGFDYERVGTNELWFPSCPIQRVNATGFMNPVDNTNIFTHSIYYKSPFINFASDGEFLGIDNASMIKMYKCALFLFTFKYSYFNITQEWFSKRGVRRMPKGLMLQLGAVAWWKKTFANVKHEKYDKLTIKDFPRYRNGELTYPFVKSGNNSDWTFAYCEKGDEKYYVTEKETMLYAFTKGDEFTENMLANRFEEFALKDTTENGENYFDTLRRMLEIRKNGVLMDATASGFNTSFVVLEHDNRNISLKERLGDDGANGGFDWDSFTKAYSGIYVNGPDVDAVFKNDGDMRKIQNLLKSLYLDEWVMLSSVPHIEPKTEMMKKAEKKSCLSYDTIINYISTLCRVWENIAEKTKNNMNVAYLSKLEGVQERQGHDALESIKIGMYNYIKNLYDRWLIQVDEKEYYVSNYYKPNFYFMTSYYENLYHKLVVNCQTATDLYKGAAYELSLYNYIDQVLTKHNCQLYVLPDFIPFGEDLKRNKELLYDVFTPLSYHDLSNNEHYNGMNMASFANCNRFVGVLKSEEPNTIAPPTYTEYKQDGFTIVQEIGERDENGMPRYDGTMDAKKIFPTRNAEKINTLNEFNTIRDNSTWDGIVPCFGVTMSRQHQHLFENVTLNMDNPVITDISARTYEDIVNVGKTGERRVYFHGQDIYSVHSAYSYGCTVTMLGNAQIQPLMYFQLNNVPMWYGAYMIYKVTHDMSVGSMKTTFEGQRVSRRQAKLNQEFASGASLLESNVGSGNDNIKIGESVVNSIAQQNTKNIEPRPIPVTVNYFKDRYHHQTDATYKLANENWSISHHFAELENIFNEFQQLNLDRKYGHKIQIASMWRENDGSASDHSNPTRYSGRAYRNRNCAMDIQISVELSETNQSGKDAKEKGLVKRDHKVDLCAPYLLYLLKKNTGRQILLEIGDNDGNYQFMNGDDTYLHCFHVSVIDGELRRHELPFSFMRKKEKKWVRMDVDVEHLPASILSVLIEYLQWCIEKNKVSEFLTMTKSINFGNDVGMNRGRTNVNITAIREKMDKILEDKMSANQKNS